ncbi:ABC transporter ATP-binding protein [uncultured Campylobacter sp.]|uniref:ABC transporter ATP-binding protein n=1 Tax=uncultured Campylobacter sp. TaxID=218934 RepID=UPI002604EBD0|nr:ABC transporter ATP-binding protein [uncultured Campylobacter sp.]
MIDVKELSFSYGKKSVLNSVSFSCKNNQLYCLLGANGSGKSTLFKCIMNFLKPNGGTIEINREDITDKTHAWMARQISYVAQQSNPTFSFTVLEIVLMGRALELRGGLFHKKEDIELACNALERVGIIHLKDKIAMNLSGGQRQLVFIARAIVQNAPIMILDEPTSALDFKNQILFYKIVKEISKTKTVIVCTHDPNHALWFGDEIIGLKEGRVLFVTKPQEMSEELLFELYDKKCKLFRSENFIKPLV